MAGGGLPDAADRPDPLALVNLLADLDLDAIHVEVSGFDVVAVDVAVVNADVVTGAAVKPLGATLVTVPDWVAQMGWPQAPPMSAPLWSRRILRMGWIR